MSKNNVEPNAGMESNRVGQIRNRYFLGKYMNHEDFTLEQKYFRKQLRLQSRLSGCGVVEGLELEHEEKCAVINEVQLCPGYALDSWGRAIACLEKTTIDLKKELYEKKELCEWKHEEPHEGNENVCNLTEYKFFLCIQYCENEVDEFPSLDPVGKEEYLYVDESYTIDFICQEDLPKGLWRTSEGLKLKEERNDASINSNAEPLIPLAKITLNVDEDKCIHKVFIEQQGRTYISGNGNSLTRVEGISWHHGEGNSASALRQDWFSDSELVLTCPTLSIKFSDWLPAKQIHSDLANVFQVSVVNQEDHIRICKGKVDFRRNSEETTNAVDRKVLQFIFDETESRKIQSGGYGGCRFFISLKCDFLLDRNNRPVDGNFLGGLLPSGNGVAGGTFESWFTIE